MADLCNGCGRCCDPVVLPYSQRDIQMAHPLQLEDPAMRDFVLHVLRPISRREGVAKTDDYLKAGGRTLLATDPRDWKGSQDVEIVTSWFYECSWYDPETRRCTEYEKRPSMCTDFPWYGQGPDDMKAIPPECGYNAELGRPVKVDIRTKGGS